MKELLGEERIDQPSASWGDSFVVNLGTEKIDAVESKALDNWHIVVSHWRVCGLELRSSFRSIIWTLQNRRC
jgi:hypothetical protein